MTDRSNPPPPKSSHVAEQAAVQSNPALSQVAPPVPAPPDSLGAMVTSVDATPQVVAGLAGLTRPAMAGSEPAGDGAYVATSAASEPALHSVAPSSAGSAEGAAQPSFIFFGILAALALVADVASKAWAEIILGRRTMLDPALILIEDNLTLTLAYNKGGAWGLLQDASENVRRPFFFLVSILAIAFIVSLYGRLAPGQRALKWGLPLVLGGALGNLSDRVVRSSVIDFIDYRADWVRWMNERVHEHVWAGWSVTDHWPTFNVADIAICIGVGLMAIDMLFSRRGAPPSAAEVDAAALGGAPTQTNVLTQEAAGAGPAAEQPVPPRTSDVESGGGPGLSGGL